MSEMAFSSASPGGLCVDIKPGDRRLADSGQLGLPVASRVGLAHLESTKGLASVWFDACSSATCKRLHPISNYFLEYLGIFIQD